MRKIHYLPGRQFGFNNITGTFFRIAMMLLLLGKGSSGGVPTTVSGTSPLSLTNAVAGLIQSLYRYGWCEYVPEQYLSSVVQSGKCEQNDTPSTSTPVDIACNNGVLKMVDDELPAGYKRIESIGFDGNFHYITNETLFGSDEITITLGDTSTGGQNVFGSYSGTSAGTKNYSLYIYGGGANNSSYLRYGETLYRPKYGSGKRTLVYGPNGSSGFSTDVSMTPEEFETDDVAWIGMLPNSSSPHFTGTIVGNILIGNRLKYIPCERVSDGTIGYYEPNTSVFLEPAGNGTPTKGAYDGSHYHLDVVGTPETVTAGLQTATVVDLFGVGNYADTQDIISGTVIRKVGIKVLDGTEAWTRTSENRFTSVIDDVLAGTGNAILCTHYEYSRNATSSNCCRITDTGRLYICDTGGYDTASDFKAFLASQYAVGTPVIAIYPLAEEVTESTTPQVIVNETIVPSSEYIDNIVITTAKTKWTTPDVNHPLDIICNNGVVTVNGALGPVETVTISADGVEDQTFTVEDLLGVGDYKDMEEVVSGVVTRKCTVCVYDGTQSIGSPYMSTTGGLDIGATIVYYTGGETTEQVTPNELTVADGDNTVTSSVDDAEITVTYPAERQNSNLVGNAIVGTATAG